jgi:hypothetical protein
MKDARRLDVVLHSATGLKKVSASKMAVFAVAWIEPSVRVPSPANVKAHGTNPVWNTTISLSLEERTIAHGMYLNIELLGHGLVSTRRIGFVSVNMTNIFQEGSKGAAVHSHFLAHPVNPIPSNHHQFSNNFFSPFLPSSHAVHKKINHELLVIHRCGHDLRSEACAHFNIFSSKCW